MPQSFVSCFWHQVPRSKIPTATHPFSQFFSNAIIPLFPLGKNTSISLEVKSRLGTVSTNEFSFSWRALFTFVDWPMAPVSSQNTHVHNNTAPKSGISTFLRSSFPGSLLEQRKLWLFKSTSNLHWHLHTQPAAAQQKCKHSGDKEYNGDKYAITYNCLVVLFSLARS